MSVIHLEGVNNQALADKVKDIGDRLISAAWFSNAGVIDKAVEDFIQKFLRLMNVDGVEIGWVSKEDLSVIIEKFNFTDNELWEVLKNLPEEMKIKIENNNRLLALEEIVEILPEAVFHPAFAGAFKELGDGDKKIVGFFTGLAMYLSLMITVSVLAGQEDLFIPILSIIESGHVPIGLDRNFVYMI